MNVSILATVLFWTGGQFKILKYGFKNVVGVLYTLKKNKAGFNVCKMIMLNNNKK